MKKIIFALCLLSAAQAYQNTSFAQIIPTEEPMPDPDLPPTKADLFKKFAKISLPLNLEIISEAEAQKIIKEKKLQKVVKKVKLVIGIMYIFHYNNLKI